MCRILVILFEYETMVLLLWCLIQTLCFECGQMYPWISFPSKWIDHLASSNIWTRYILSDLELFSQRCIFLEKMASITNIIDLLTCINNARLSAYNARAKISMYTTRHILPLGSFNVHSNKNNIIISVHQKFTLNITFIDVKITRI